MKRLLASIKETDIAKPVEQYLKEQGFHVQSEVGAFDIVGTKENETIAVELKKSFSLKLLYQAIDRQTMLDSVYIAIPVKELNFPRDWKHVQRLAKRLELGIILVRFYKNRTDVDIVISPRTWERRKNKRKASRLIQELEGRKTALNIGGSTAVPKITAYREAAIFLCHLLRLHGPSSPKTLRSFGAPSKTASILYQNHYGWFLRPRRGVYEVSNAGKEACDKFSEVIAAWNENEGKR